MPAAEGLKESGGVRGVGKRCFSCSLLTASFPQNHINFPLSRRAALSVPSAQRVTGLGGAGVPPSPPLGAIWGAHGCLFPPPGTHPGGAGAAHLAGGPGESCVLPPKDGFPPRCSCKNPMKLGLLQQGGVQEGRREEGELPACPALPVLSKDAA